MTDSHKQFLKRNELASALEAPVSFVEKYRVWIGISVVLVLGFFIGSKVIEMNHNSRIKAFNSELYRVSQNPNKETGLREILKNYSDVQAVRYVYLELAENLIELDQIAEAEKILLEGIESAKTPDIYSTMLVLRLLSLTEEKQGTAKGLEVAAKYQDRLIETFKGSFQLMVAEMQLASGAREEATKILQSLADIKTSGKGIEAGVTQEARQKLQLIQLGKL